MNVSAARTGSRPVPVGELVSAWWAVQRGEFRPGSTKRLAQATVGRAGTAWRPAPGEVPVLVVGCAGSVGASTVALLLGAAATRSRVVECAPAACSGLSGASTAELGEAADGWLEGTRAELRIQRRRDQAASPDLIPPPLPGTTGGVTVVDCWWDLRQVLAGQGWLAELGRSCSRVVLVAKASVPGMRQLEGNLGLVGADRCWTVATGSSMQHLSRQVQHSMGPLTRQLHRAGRFHCVPDNRSLALSGITTEPLPKAYSHTATRLLEGLLP